MSLETRLDDAEDRLQNDGDDDVIDVRIVHEDRRLCADGSRQTVQVEADDYVVRESPGPGLRIRRQVPLYRDPATGELSETPPKTHH